MTTIIDSAEELAEIVTGMIAIRLDEFDVMERPGRRGLLMALNLAKLDAIEAKLQVFIGRADECRWDMDAKGDVTALTVPVRIQDERMDIRFFLVEEVPCLI